MEAFFTVLVAIPIWVWVVVFFAVLFLLGDTKHWEYEAKFPRLEGFGRGEVEFNSFKKRGTEIEVKLKLDKRACGSHIEVRLNDKLVYELPPEKTREEFVFIMEKIAFDEPSEGDEVSIWAEGEKKLSGPLIID